ncbi:hypothetical protein BGY98DRAFT_1034770, partial [Russula aff. rugulosa BPL654]
MPNILSQNTLSPAKNTFSSLPVSFDFYVLFLHTISLIHRHGAISPFTIPKWPFLNLKASNHHFIQDST